MGELSTRVSIPAMVQETLKGLCLMVSRSVGGMKRSRACISCEIRSNADGLIPGNKYDIKKEVVERLGGADSPFVPGINPVTMSDPSVPIAWTGKRELRCAGNPVFHG